MTRATLTRSRGARMAVACATVLAIVVGGFVATPPLAAEAAEGTGFDPGLIISDENFFNSSAMDESAIQSFLNSKGSGCSSGLCIKNYTAASNSRVDDNYCDGYAGSSSESAARIIARVAQSCGINPQVLLVVLEKEQSLISTSSPSSDRYQIAMGYGCPDTAPCDAEYFGFFNQVWSAARQFQRYTVNTTSYQYQPGRSNYILYNPDTSCGGSNVYIQNQATANLYIYTPYQPNQSALNNMYGTGDGCGSYGNRNFWRIFTDWFGNPGNLVRSGGFEGGSTAGWRPSSSSVNMTAYATSRTGLPSKFGGWFGATNRGGTNGSVYQDISKSSSPGQTYVGQVWMRSANPSVTFSGSLALWGLGGGGVELGSTAFSVGSDWTLVQVNLSTQNSHDTLRLEIYEDTRGSDLFLDGAVILPGLSSDAPESSNVLKTPSFEGASTNNWTTNGVTLTSVASTSNIAAREGSYFATSNRGNGGSLLQDVSKTTSAGQNITASVWVRSSEPAVPFDGELAVWGLGGTAPEVSSTKFTATGEWTLVTASFSPAVAHSVLRLEIYENTSGPDLQLDGAQLYSNLLPGGSFENGQTSPWNANGLSLASTDSTVSTLPARDGRNYGASSTATGSGSIFVDVAKNTPAGQPYSATVWVRSSNAAVPFDGEVTLWGLGGSSAEYGATKFTATDTWSQVTVSLNPNVAHSVLRLEIYEFTTGAELHLDAAQLVSNALKTPSFEASSTSNWTGNGVTLASTAGSFVRPAREGSFFATGSRGSNGGSFLQDAPKTSGPAQPVTATMWVRSSDPGVPFNGELAVWGLGGSSAPEVSSTRFTATADWTFVTVSFAPTTSHSVLRFEVYENTSGANLEVDGAQIR